MKPKLLIETTREELIDLVINDYGLPKEQLIESRLSSRGLVLCFKEINLTVTGGSSD